MAFSMDRHVDRLHHRRQGWLSCCSFPFVAVWPGSISVWCRHSSCQGFLAAAFLGPHHTRIRIPFSDARSLPGQLSAIWIVAFGSICSFVGSEAFPSIGLAFGDDPGNQDSPEAHSSSVVEIEAAAGPDRARLDLGGACN